MSAASQLNIRGAKRTPLIRQAETSECGLACIAMVAAHHGLIVDMPTLRRRFDVGQRGTTLKSLMTIAGDVGFNARAIRCSVDRLGDLKLPAVLHWNFNHFVVLAKISASTSAPRYEILDPATGAQSIAREELSSCFTGVALELIPSVRFTPQRAASPLRISQLWTSMHGLWPSLGRIVSLSLLLQLAALAMPFYLQLGVDTVLPAGDERLLGSLALGFGGLAVLSGLLGWLRQTAILAAASAIGFQIVDNLFRHLLSLPLTWFERRHVGDIISRFSSIQPVTDFMSQGVVTAVVDGLLTTTTLVLMCIYSPLLSGVAVLAGALYVVIRLSSLQTIRRLNVGTIAANARENSSFIESVRGIATIKANGQEAARRWAWQPLKATAVNAQLRLGRVTAGFEASANLVVALERVAFVYLALQLVLGGSFTIGMVFAFQAYKEQFLGAAVRLAEQWVKYRLVDTHLTRIADVALSRPEDQGHAHSARRRPINGKIELKDVSFRYSQSEPDVLRHVSLTVEPGALMALVGPSGGGKTTLLKLMIGVLEPTEGMILIDDVPMRALGVGAWRSAIGTVLQEDSLFAGTIGENIAMLDASIDQHEIEQACRAAGILEEIEKMPLGFDTLVGDMGSTLSGGQKQRILLARALCRRASALFMDEGTANLDGSAENVVVEAVSRLTITRVISAHRPQPVSRASAVFLVSDGRVQQAKLNRPERELADAT